MQPSLPPRRKALISLKQSFALFTILLLASHLHALTVAEQYLYAAANQARASQGLPALRLDPVLSQASAQHAREMAEHAAISHQFSDEADLAERGASAGAHFSLISENVAEAPSSITIHELWMNSPHHRANLLDPNVDSVGIAIVRRDNQLYAVEDFASTVQTLSLTQQERTVASVLSQTGLHIAATTEDARETCAMSTGWAGSRQPWFVMRYTASSLDQIPSQLKSRLSTGKYHQAIVGACSPASKTPFTAYNIAILLYP
ncbi:MAG: CAP domain-containing protein [Edaphobacter sp.]